MSNLLQASLHIEFTHYFPAIVFQVLVFIKSYYSSKLCMIFHLNLAGGS